jgi:hypothetical protein
LIETVDTVSAHNAAAAYNAKAASEGWPALCDASLSFRRPELTALVNIWREKAGTNGIPRRQDISHRSLSSLLARIAIYQRVEGSERRYRVRLIGTLLAQALGGDLTGRFLDESVPTQFLPRWQTALDAAIAARAPLRFVTCGTLDRSYLAGEYFEAPLLSDNGEADLVIGAGHHSAERSWSEACTAEITAALR